LMSVMFCFRGGGHRLQCGPTRCCPLSRPDLPEVTNPEVAASNFLRLHHPLSPDT
jgi:hypothetical protein